MERVKWMQRLERHKVIEFSSREEWIEMYATSTSYAYKYIFQPFVQCNWRYLENEWTRLTCDECNVNNAKWGRNFRIRETFSFQKFKRSSDWSACALCTVHRGIHLVHSSSMFSKILLVYFQFFIFFFGQKNANKVFSFQLSTCWNVYKTFWLTLSSCNTQFQRFRIQNPHEDDDDGERFMRRELNLHTLH